MSLVNDALKRAKDAQQKSPPSAPAPKFRPPEPAPQPTRGMGMTVPVIIALLAIVGLSFVWLNQRHRAARKDVAEITPAAPVVAIPKAKPPVQVAVATPKPVAPVAEKPAPAAAIVPPVNVPAPDLKLQAIFFSPGRSSAIISGKTVRVGNVLKGFRVAAITEASATLVSATQTNVMILDQ